MWGPELPFHELYFPLLHPKAKSKHIGGWKAQLNPLHARQHPASYITLILLLKEQM